MASRYTFSTFEEEMETLNNDQEAGKEHHPAPLTKVEWLRASSARVVVKKMKPPTSRAADLRAFKGNQCQRCPKSFRHSSSLRKHKRAAHSLARPYKCGQCRFASGYRTSLDFHVAGEHLGVRPFACGQCGHRAARFEQLDSHLSGAPGCRLLSGSTAGMRRHHRLAGHGLRQLARAAKRSLQEVRAAGGLERQEEAEVKNRRVKASKLEKAAKDEPVTAVKQGKKEEEGEAVKEEDEYWKKMGKLASLETPKGDELLLGVWLEFRKKFGDQILVQ